jgi:hypothetical protein
LIEVEAPEHDARAACRGLFEPAFGLGDEVRAGQAAGHIHFIDDPAMPSRPFTPAPARLRSGIPVCSGAEVSSRGRAEHRPVVHELPDRRDRLFGREQDLARLIDRVRFKGLTAVVARPAMGKSWLLTELARRLAAEHEPRHLVGFARSSGQTPDLLLRAVVDLYGRWLSDAGY